MSEREIRSFGGAIETRAEDDGHILLRGQPIVFNQKTDIGGYFEEEIASGAIEDKILRDVCLLVNHDFESIPLARSRNNNKNSNLRFSVGADAVDMESDLDPKNPRALEVDSAVARGDMPGMSFAFSVAEDRWDRLDTDYPKRTIIRVDKIWEVSICTWPAYTGTSIQSERSLESGLESLKRAREELESARVRSARIADLNKRLEEINHD